jgi:hypothetical protein
MPLAATLYEWLMFLDVLAAMIWLTCGRPRSVLLSTSERGRSLP